LAEALFLNSFRIDRLMSKKESKKAVIIGGGGHAKVTIEALASSGAVEIIGIIDSNPDLAGALVESTLVIGGDDRLRELSHEGVTHYIIGVGSTGNAAPRKRLFEMASELGLIPISAVHPDASVAESAKIGAGTLICAGTVINPDVTVGENVIVNIGVSIVHDSVIGDHTHLAPGATLGGNVHVGPMAHVGIGANIREGIKIGARAIIAAGAMVVKDVVADTIVAGVPAKPMAEIK
jgi:sugar O-acyltransferase (sialic acid O-acetyltransferase NeuD family)